MKVNLFRWPNPILNDDANTVFEENYGENAQFFLNVLKSCPEEIGVIAMLLAYLNSLKKE